MIRTSAGTVALLLVLAASTAGCSNQGGRAAEALTECIEGAGETPESAVTVELGANGEIIVASAPGISASVADQCLAEYNSGLPGRWCSRYVASLSILIRF